MSCFKSNFVPFVSLNIGNIWFSTLLEYILCYPQLKCVMLQKCTLLYFVLMIVRSSLITVISSKFLWYIRLPKGRIMYHIVIPCSPSAHPSDSASDSFPHFSRTCFDILHWNFMYDFVFQHVCWILFTICRSFALFQLIIYLVTCYHSFPKVLLIWHFELKFSILSHVNECLSVCFSSSHMFRSHPLVIVTLCNWIEEHVCSSLIILILF